MPRGRVVLKPLALWRTQNVRSTPAKASRLMYFFMCGYKNFIHQSVFGPQSRPEVTYPYLSARYCAMKNSTRRHYPTTSCGYLLVFIRSTQFPVSSRPLGTTYFREALKPKDLWAVLSAKLPTYVESL